MDSLIKELNKKYDAILDGFEHRGHVDSPAFYSTYDYFCITEQQPIVRKILSEDVSILEKNRQKILSGQMGTEEKEVAITRLNEHSLSFCYGEIKNSVYLPISKYKTSHPLSEIGQGVEIGVGRVYLWVTFLIKKLVKFYFIIRKQKNRLIEVRYREVIMNLEENFKNEKYETYVIRTHRELIARLLAEGSFNPSVPDKNTVFRFNSETGECEYNNVKTNFSPESKEFVFLRALYLAKGNPVSYKDLVDPKYGVSAESKNVLSETIKSVKKKLGILPISKNSNKDILENVKKYGYKLSL